MDLTEQQVNYLAGLRAMADYLEENPALIPPRGIPATYLHVYSVEETVAVIEAMGEPLTESSGMVEREYGSFRVSLSIPATARVQVKQLGLVPEVAAALQQAATATASRVAAEFRAEALARANDEVAVA